MPKTKSPKVAETPHLEDEAAIPHLSIETFRVDKVRRSLVKAATYNPRVITAEARRKLGVVLDAVGTVEPLVWNKRTGNLVGGHQRLQKFDRKMGFPSKLKDYTLTMAVIDVDDATERAVNAALNNAAAQGEFDVEKLDAMLRFPGVREKIEATGWDDADLMRMFGGDADPRAAAKEAQDAADLARANAEKYDQSMMTVAEKNSDDFFMVVVFKDSAARAAFTERHGLDDNRYQSAAAIEALITADDADGAPEAD